MVLVVSYEGKQLLICTSYARTSVLPMQESREPFPSFFLPPLIFESSPTGFSPLFHRPRASESGSAFPRTPYQVLFEPTYFSEAFMRTAKTAIAGVEKRKSGKKWEKVVGGFVKRATRESSTMDAYHSWQSNYLFFREGWYGSYRSNGDTRERSG